MSSEAAELLLVELQENPLVGARHAYSIVRDRLPAILAAERRATVKRIKKAMGKAAYKLDDRRYGPRILEVSEIDAILDAEAER